MLESFHSGGSRLSHRRTAAAARRSGIFALASVLSLAAGAAGLTGCGGGGGGGGASSTPVTRTYTASNMGLTGTGLGTLSVLISNAVSSISGTFAITPVASSETRAAAPKAVVVAGTRVVLAAHSITRQAGGGTFSVTLTGSLTDSNGDFTLSGSYVDASGTTVPVTITGTLPGSSETTGGSLTITIGSAVYGASFGANPPCTVVTPTSGTTSGTIQ